MLLYTVVKIIFAYINLRTILITRTFLSKTHTWSCKTHMNVLWWYDETYTRPWYQPSYPGLVHSHQNPNVFFRLEKWCIPHNTKQSCPHNITPSSFSILDTTVLFSQKITVFSRTMRWKMPNLANLILLQKTLPMVKTYLHALASFSRNVLKFHSVDDQNLSL